MSLTDRNRSLIHRRLTEIVGDEEAVSEMLSHFPVDDHDRPATVSDLATFRGEMRGEFGDLRGEFGILRGEFAELRGEFGDLRGDLAEVRGEMRGEFAEVRGEMQQMEARLTTTLHATITRSMQWTVGVTLAAWSSLVVALVSGQVFG